MFCAAVPAMIMVPPLIVPLLVNVDPVMVMFPAFANTAFWSIISFTTDVALPHCVLLKFPLISTLDAVVGTPELQAVPFQVVDPDGVKADDAELEAPVRLWLLVAVTVNV